MHQLITPLVSTVALFNLWLGVLVLYKDFKNRINQTFFGLCLSFVFWEIVIALLYVFKTPFIAKLSFLSGVGIGYFFLMLTFYFPGRIEVNRRLKYLLLFVAFVFALLSLTDLINKSYEPQVLGPLYPWYAIFLGTYLLWGFVNLILQYRKLSLLEKRQILYLIFGFFLTIASAFTSNVILPLVVGNARMVQYGPIFPVFIIGFTTIAILKHHLMNIKVVAAEILIFILLTISFIEIFLAQSTGEVVWKISLFGGLIFIGVLFIKSIINEVTRREEMQKLALELKKANEVLETLNQAKSEFISIASHQLRTPLSIIKGYLSMILEGDYGLVRKVVEKILAKVYNSNERLINLVNDLLNLSRIESGRLEYRLEPEQLEILAQELVESFQIKAKEKKLALRFECAKSLPPIKIDAPKLREVISNLLDNAIKYTERGKILATVQNKGGQLIFTVEDTGLGIASSEQAKIFDKFTRGRNLYVSGGGLGIGLYVCKKFVEGHGGKIWVESAGPGKGSKFIFTLPITK